MRTYDDVQIIATGQGDDCTTGCLLDFNFFNSYYKMIAIDLSKQQGFDADPKVIQQINFTGNLDQWASAIMFSLLKKKRNHFIFFTRNCESVVNVFHNFILF